MDTRVLNPLTLAFMGDAVYEQLSREYIIMRHGSLSAAKLHRLTVELVRAVAQAQAVERLAPHLTEQEQTVFKRGRNSNAVTVPKSCLPSQYRAATGLEALFGWLYFEKQHQRIQTLFNICVEEAEQSEAWSGSDSRGDAID